MSFFDDFAGLFKGGSNDSRERQSNATGSNNDENLLDSLGKNLGNTWKSLTSFISPPESKPDQNFKTKQSDSISVTKEAELKARESALEAQKLINHSPREHKNQFQIGKLSNPPQAGQKRKEPDSGFDQDPSTKKLRSDSLGHLTPTQLWQQHGIVASPEITAKSLDKSIGRAKWQANRIGIEVDNQGGHLSLRGTHFERRDPEVWKGQSSLAGRPNPHDRLWQGENLKSLERSRSESSLIAMLQAQEVAAGLKKIEKRDGKFLRYALGRSRTNVTRGGGSAGKW